jgi:hypothetical protein
VLSHAYHICGTASPPLNGSDGVFSFASTRDLREVPTARNSLVVHRRMMGTSAAQLSQLERFVVLRCVALCKLLGCKWRAGNQMTEPR